jgi:hypothetical protein
MACKAFPNSWVWPAQVEKVEIAPANPTINAGLRQPNGRGPAALKCYENLDKSATLGSASDWSSRVSRVVSARMEKIAESPKYTWEVQFSILHAALGICSVGDENLHIR